MWYVTILKTKTLYNYKAIYIRNGELTLKYNEIENIVEKYSDMLFRLCFIMLENRQDAEDALQETFFRYIEKNGLFNDEKHQKAWLIKVATNICKDMLRFRLRHPKIELTESICNDISQESIDVLEELMVLPKNTKSVMYMHYIEGYKISEIAEILEISVSAVKKRLERGRKKLKIQMEEI